MPPRYAYWTILVDDQPTAFRAGAQEDLMPTFKRLKQKHPSAVMKWFQNGKLWESRIDAQEAMRARGEMGRRGDERQAGSGFRDRERRPGRERSDGKRSAWTPRGEPSTPAPARTADDKLEWKPKGEFTPAPKRSDRAEWKPKTARSDKPEWKPKTARSDKPDWKSKTSRSEKPDWKPKGRKPFSSDKPEWKPKGEFTPAPRRSEKPDWKPKSFKRPDFKPSGDDSRPAKPEWKPKGSFDRGRKPDWKPKGSTDRDRKPEWKPRGKAAGANFSSPAGERESRREPLEWTPKGDQPKTQGPRPESPEKRKWVPKADYKKSQGIEARRDKNWRPGGEHKDPRQKYKDAKKAKWTRFKKAVRTRWEDKTKKKP